MDGSTTARVRNNVGVSPPLHEGRVRERREDEQQRARVEEEINAEDVHLCGRTPDRRPWSRMEDECLTRVVSDKDIEQWSMVAGNLCTEIAGTLRSGKQCRERWLNYLDPCLKREGDHWTEEEEKTIRDARLRMGDRWVDIAKLLKGRTEESVKKHWWFTMCRRFPSRHDVGEGGSCGRCDRSTSGGSAALISSRPGGKGNGPGKLSPSPKTTLGDRGCRRFNSPANSHDGNETSSVPGRRHTRKADFTCEHGGPSAPASPPGAIGSGSSVVPMSSPSSGVTAPAATSTGQRQVSDVRFSGDSSEPGPLQETDAAPADNELCPYDAIIAGSGIVDNAVDDGSRHPSPTTMGDPVSYCDEGHVAYSQQMLAGSTSDGNFSLLTAPASSVASYIVEEQQSNSKRPRPRLFVNTSVDAGFYMARGYQGTEGGSAAYDLTDLTAAPDTRAASMVSGSTTGAFHACPPPRMDSFKAAAAGNPAETTPLYGGSMGPIGSPTIPSVHQTAQYPQQQQQQQQQQRYIVGMGQSGGRRGYAGEYPMAIPGTSVRRYMHMQLLLALMTAPGLSVVTPAKVSWDRLGYYSVDAVFGPPAPGSKPSFPRGLPPRFSPVFPPPATPPPSVESPYFTQDVRPPPSKRIRSIQEPDRGRGSGKSGGDGGRVGLAAHTVGLPNTGAMAMPPAQHSPRTSAILSGLLGTESDMMLCDTGEMPYQAPSPTAFMGMGSLEPMSPSYFPSSGELGVAEERGSAGGGGARDNRGGGRGGGTGKVGSGRGDGVGSNDSGESAEEDGHSFDFVAAFEGGSQGMMPGFPDFGPICSPKPVSPAFGTGRLSPLAGAISPSSLSPRSNWTSGF